MAKVISTHRSNRELISIYDTMYKHNGPCYWWPADTQFEVVVGAILTQFVSWHNVETAINKMKDENLLEIKNICKVSYERLENIIRSTRFYKQKAKKLKTFCLHIQNNYDFDLSKFFGRDIYEVRKELLLLYGIGEETCDCILLYAGYMPIFVVDAYTKRIFSRMGYLNEKMPYYEVQKYFMDNLENNVVLFNEFHAQIDRIGNKYCQKSNPRCDQCPLSLKLCKFIGL